MGNKPGQKRKRELWMKARRESVMNCHISFLIDIIEGRNIILQI
jgi:hypothetical protein